MIPLWLIMLLQKFAPILGEKMLEMLVKKMETVQFKKSAQEVVLEKETSWVSHLPKLFLKAGVLINGGHFYPEMVAIINAVRETAPETTDGAVWITAGAEKASGRVPNSLHYKNRAFDFRISNLRNPESAQEWVFKIIEKLGPEYDVVLESNHIHIEFDPDTLKNT